MSDEALAWFFMGEGSFGIHLQRCSRVRTGIRFIPRVLITNKDLALIREVELWLKSKGFRSQLRGQKKANGTIYALAMARGYESPKRVVEILLPHLMGTKKREAIMLKEFIERFGRKKGNSYGSFQEEWKRFAQALAYVDHFRSFDPRRKKRTSVIGLKALQELREHQC